MIKNKGLNYINSNSSVGKLTNRLSIREVVNILKSINVKGLSDNKLNELANKLEIELKLAYPRGKPSPLRIRELLKLRQINRNRNNLRKTHKAVKKEKKNRNKKMLNEFMKNPKYNSNNMTNRMFKEVEKRSKEKKKEAPNLKKKLENAERSRIEGLVRSLPVSEAMSEEAPTPFPEVPKGFSGGRKKTKTKTKRKTTKKKTRKPKVHTGPRGGKYIMRKGKKVYV